MPIPSDASARLAPMEQWSAQPRQKPASVFGNYSPGRNPEAGDAGAAVGAGGAVSDLPLQAAIDAAVARSFVYRFLAQAYEDPAEDRWDAMGSEGSRRAIEAAVKALGSTELAQSFVDVARHIVPEGYEAYLSEHLAAFGHAARGRCPLNEIEYGDIKADPLFQPHRLADLAAFYRAFGLEVSDGAGERHDHISVELEFMCVLAAKEAYAYEHQFDDHDLDVCRNAQRKFLREHLARWAPAFTRRLERMAGLSYLGAVAGFTRAFLELECSRFAVHPGSEDLLLRAVDQAAESLCSSCGLGQRPD